MFSGACKCFEDAFFEQLFMILVFLLSFAVLLLTGIFILFWLQYQFTVMKLQDLEESSFLSKSTQVISIKDSRLIIIIKQKI